MSIDAEAKALHITRLLDQKGAENIQLLQVDPSSGALFDYAIVVTGRSERQLNTFMQEALHLCKRQKLAYNQPETAENWHLIDCYEVVVHAMLEEAREYYRLEALWPDAHQLDHSALLSELPYLPCEEEAMAKNNNPFG